MFGQGGPASWRTRLAASASRVLLPARCLAPLVCLAVILLGSEAAADGTFYVRIAWGGGSERLWYGNVALTEGTFSEPNPLGIEADEPGSMWLDTTASFLHPLPASLASVPAGGIQPEHLVIRQRSPRTYDAVDLTVSAPPEATLLVELVAADEPGKPGWLAIRLADLLEGHQSRPLDDRGNSLLVQRRADDDLRVKFQDGDLVFSPGEVFQFELFPHLPAAPPGTELRVEAEMVAARGAQPLWSGEYAAAAGQSVAIPLEITLPEQEGAYEVVLTARHGPGLRWPPSVSTGLKWKRQPLAVRRVQLLVLRPEQPEAPLLGGGQPEPIVDEIDPANSKWWDRFAKLPHLRRSNRPPRGPLGNGRSQTISHPLGQVVELRPSGGSSDASWEAYALEVEEPGRPHAVEVDYPSDVPQTIGVSILEPNAAGALFPIGLDSGFDQAEEMLGGAEPPQWRTHRVIIWPRTKAPIVLLTNRREETAAVYGKIRVRSLGGQLARANSPAEPTPQRLLAAYLDRPLFPENHSAEEALGSLSDLGVDDWVTFHQGGTRLVAYLNHVGYGGLMITALADGSTIYPSRILEPTPRYDTGAFLAAGQDPIRKDVLEMLFRLFDRDRLKLVPAIEFAAPLPELEAALRRGGPESEGIRWIGPQGRAWTETQTPVRGLAPYYNVLHPKVQDSMLLVVRELVRRYGHHPSFSGLGIQLSAHGYAQLPGPQWGMDDATVARFEQETGVKVPASGPQRFAQRAERLLGPEREAWLAWRARSLSRFFLRVREEMAAVRADAPLYLAAVGVFDGDLKRQLQPSLPQRMTMAQALLEVGIDASHYGQDRRIVLLQPKEVAPRISLSSQALSLVVRQMDDADAYFRASGTPGSLFFHRPQELRLASFDQKSPFVRSYTWLATQAVPSGPQNRERFVHSLASLDAQVMFDGGWQLPMGQQAAIGDLAASYRRLPAVRFEKYVDPTGRTSSRPVTVRWAVVGQHTYLYAVNEAPFAATARLDLACPNPCRLEELSGMRQVAEPRAGPLGTSWTVRLEPHDLVAVRLSSPAVKIVGVEVTWPEEVQKKLWMRITELGDRAATLRNPPLLAGVNNADFERPLDPSGRIPGWAASSRDGVSIGLDADHRHEGGKSVRMASTGPVATLISAPFDAPATGRLTMSVWLRAADAARQPPLQLALVGKHHGRDLFYFAPVGQAAAQDPPPPALGPQWERIVVEINDLPLENLRQLQLRFDLLGPGEVWIDDVQLSALAFSKNEWVELLKLIAPAEKGQVGDCLALLESYWPRFLLANVPVVPRPLRPDLPAPLPPSIEVSETPVETGFLDRMKDRLPGWLRF